MENTELKVRKPGGGRRELSDDLRRCIRIQPSFTLSEFDTVVERAAAIGVDKSEWLRLAALGETIKSVPAINRLAYAELSKLAGNLNQLAAKANSTGHLNATEIAELTGKTSAQLHALRLELLGKGI
jgi:hypothetical protein